MNRFLCTTFPAIFLFNLAVIGWASAQSKNSTPLRLAVAGISHGHAGWILGRKNNAAITVVGIFESNTDLSQKSAGKHNLPATLFYSDLNKMLDTVKPEAVVAFGSIYEHMAVVEACAPPGNTRDG